MYYAEIVFFSLYFMLDEWKFVCIVLAKCVFGKLFLFYCQTFQQYGCLIRFEMIVSLRRSSGSVDEDIVRMLLLMGIVWQQQ